MVKIKKKVPEEPSRRDSDYYYRLEIDCQAIRGKNRELVQQVAKLQQEKTLQEKHITSLQKEYFILNSKFLNLKSVFNTVDATVKTSFPKVAEVVQHLAKIMQLCSVGSVVSNPNKDPKTQAVTPHTVNGTVIQSPTITLARFRDLTPSTPSLNNGPNDAQHSSIYQDPRPSTSRELTENVPDKENTRPNFVNCTRRVLVPLDIIDQEGELQNEGSNSEENEENDSRLVTIAEEDEGEYTHLNSSDVVREIRIYLSPLKDIDAEIKLNRSKVYNSSLSGEVSKSMLEKNASPNSSKRKSLSFNLEDSEYWANNINNSFTFTENISSIQNCPDTEATCSTTLSCTENSKFITMQSLGLEPIEKQLTTSTPLIQSPRVSKRFSRRFDETLKHKISKSPSTNITKRKPSGECVAQVVIKRLNLGASTSPRRTLETTLVTSPMVSLTEIKQKYKNIDSNKSNKSQKSPEAKKEKKLKKKGKENLKTPSAIEPNRTSPRPRRAARPTTLREPSLNKKMRRSK